MYSTAGLLLRKQDRDDTAAKCALYRAIHCMICFIKLCRYVALRSVGMPHEGWVSYMGAHENGAPAVIYVR